MEDAFHFFIICPAYAALRRDLFSELTRVHRPSQTLIRDPARWKNLLNIIVYGVEKPDTDIKIFTIAANFITDSDRFN
jgi:hypothetical protein